MIKAVKELNKKNINLTDGIVSGTSEDTLIIQKGDKRFFLRIDKKLGINNSIDEAIYDIRVPEAWQLEHLANIFRQKFQGDIVPCTFVLKDSVGKQLNYWGREGEEGLFNESYTVPLGFLEGHHLTVYYSFPLRYFWYLEKKNFLVSLGILLLLTACIFLLFRINLQNEKRIDNQELLVQALNHDLKSPLNDLLMKLFLIQKESPLPFTNSQEELYWAARTKMERLLGAIHRLLQDSINYKGLHLIVKEVDLNSFLLQLTEESKKKWADDKKQVYLSLHTEISNVFLRVDPYHLFRVINNLLDNAYKYSNAKVKIDITCKRVGQYIEISVKDNGQGIEKSEIKKIFKRNYRGRSGVESKIKGYGLGLSYVKLIIKAHGGKIRVKSDYGKGTEFIIRLKG